MSQARVSDIDYLKQFRLALQKFQESATVALSDAESDLVRTSLWLDTEQTAYWNFQLKKRAEALSQAEERLRMKKVFKDATGARQSVVDEEKAVKIARARLEDAQRKVAAVTKWRRQMEKVGHDYKGSVQRFATTVQSTLPAAIARLEVMIRQLEQYVGYRPEEVGSTAEAPAVAGSSAGEPAASMKRGVVDEPPADAEESSAQKKQADTGG